MGKRPHSAEIDFLLADASKPPLRTACGRRPDREQAMLLQHLGRTLPELLRPLPMPRM